MSVPDILLRALIAVGVPLVFAACARQTIYQDVQPIPAAGWQVDQLVAFEVEISDTIPLHELYMLVRNTTDYPYSNLYLFLDIVFPDNRVLRDTLECMLAARDGSWTGKGFGKIRSNQFLFRDNVWFPQTGTYQFLVQHGMREDVLKGVSDIGIRLDKK